ncbi:MAG: ABC transporter ATP-binding protein, partial [Firmicutes bacterium]|nr:ABC transporter ATP-binding protein [Bacillota bacterium]
IDELCRINEEMGKTIAMVTHDAYMASRCKRVILLKDGNIMEDLVKDCTREEFYKRIQSEMERLYDR